MHFYLRQPLPTIASSETSFSSDNSHLPDVHISSAPIFHELNVDELDDIRSTGFNHQYPIQRESFPIPRPLFTIPRPKIYLPINNSSWTPHTGSICTRRSSSPSLITHHTERPLYQNLPPPPPTISSLAASYPIEPLPYQRFLPIPYIYPKKQKRFLREKPPGIFTTLSAGGFNTLAGLIYLVFLLALPVSKLVLGILYIQECPVNRNIPLYLIIAGGCGLAFIILMLLSSACTLCRSVANTKKPIHGLMICTIAFTRGLQGSIAIFLFIWFLFGNIWVFNARHRLRTDKPNDINNYCHPTLYWFAFYTLIFTYIYAFLTCCCKFCVNFFCCGAFNTWHKAFS